VYGLDESVTAESGLRVNLFQALLSMELMSAFFSTDFMIPYATHLAETGQWRMALGRLAVDGLLRPSSQNRFPVTWSDRAAKIENVLRWTVSNDFPNVNAKAADAILDFWTSDWGALSARLRAGAQS
jgi:hypothetical protein